ncbi:hypothetical protein MATL_G00038310 [Megalops atlanticus]|uniref:RETREG1-3/ARL6IP-like N-terminal reticulon-homology domain-containing protein n=1 Tax=Megalops atlanticus TaxID=7932 RepID=A0A9D3QE23_MEGAT|nr:hypothetical protein MATL_G00038310 [Megalops atlanticus]
MTSPSSTTTLDVSDVIKPATTIIPGVIWLTEGIGQIFANIPMASHERHRNEDASDMGQEGSTVAASLHMSEAEGSAPQGRREQPAGRSTVSRISDVITWRRPLLTTAVFAITNSAFWFVALSTWRVYYLLTLCLVTVVTVQMVKDLALSRKRGAHLWHSMTESWEVIDSSQEYSDLAEQLAESWMSCKLFLQEMASFKQQNPGKFCLLVCSLCTFLAMLGRCVPGVVISYIVVLGIFLWPLMSSHQLGLWVKPVLQKLDFGVASFLHKMKENREKRMLQKQENSEIDISALCPKMDSAIFKELSVSDTEASEVTWTDGTFNLSEGHTPQTENSEDLDRRSDQEEFFTEGLPEFPNVDNGTNGEDDELSIGLPTPLPMLDMARALGEGRALELVNQMAGDVIAGAVTAAIQEQLRACAPRPAPEPLDFAEDSDSEGEEFELLDQSELENLESNLGQEARAKAKKPSGFLSNLLRHH